MSNNYAELGPVSTFGVPIIGGAPALLPFTGTYVWVNESTGSDGFPGTADQPFKTLSYALTQCGDGNGSVIFFQGTIHLTSKLTWNKQVHLVGLDAPLQRGKRARISVSGSTAFSPMVDVTASGCWFVNFGTFYGFNSASNNAICWQDSAGRSCYDNVEFMGFGDGTVTTGTANIVGARAFKFNNNTGETTWRSCVFGVDTVTRNATNYTVELAGGAPRLTLLDCIFEAYLGASGGASSHVLIGASGIDRYVDFVRCRFHAAGDSGGTAMAQAFNVNGAPGGTVFLDQCTVGNGVTAIQTTPVTAMQMNMVAATTGGGKTHVVF